METKIQEYIRKTVSSDDLLSEYLTQQQPKNEEEDDYMACTTDRWKRWLEKAGLKDSTVALIIAAQEQTVSTRSLKAGSTTPDSTSQRGCKKKWHTWNSNICAEYGLEAPRS